VISICHCLLPRYRAAAERRLVESGSDDDASMRYASALTNWEDLGGYDLEIAWAASADRAVSLSWSALADRAITTCSTSQTTSSTSRVSSGWHRD